MIALAFILKLNYHICMRKLTISFLIALLGFVSVRTPFPVLSETNFARIEKTSEIFRTNSTSTSIDNIICLAEETYFVEIISDYDTLYKVEYNGIIGFIKKTDVTNKLKLSNDFGGDYQIFTLYLQQ